MKGGRYESTQKETVLGHIRDFGGITPADAFRDLGITRLAAVACKPRREGHGMHREREHALNRYGQNARYARYSLGNDGGNENQAR